jgi:hypothetical protein
MQLEQNVVGVAGDVAQEAVAFIARDQLAGRQAAAANLFAIEVSGNS